MTANESSERPFESTEHIRAGLELIERETPCDISLAAKDLDTGDAILFHADRRVKTASVIKFPMLIHVATAVSRGELSWEELLTLRAEEKVDGSGVLTQLTAGITLSLRDICVLMMVLSDNTATNMVIERLGTAPINATIAALGCPGTVVFRKSYSPDTPESAEFGLGSTTPADQISLLERVARGEIGSLEESGNVEKMLEAQQYRDCIPRYLPEEWKYAGKTGSIDGVRNDVGLITTPAGRRFALAIFCQNLTDLRWTADNAGHIACARAARLLLLGN